MTSRTRGRGGPTSHRPSFPPARPSTRVRGPHPMIDSLVAERIDVPFAVPFVHRLRFTTDVLGAEQDVLLDVLEKSGPNPARVQFWVDGHVVAAQPGLAGRLVAFAEAHPEQVVQAGDLQVVAGGEAIKNDIHVLERMLSIFEAANLDRRSYVFVAGGGAVIDASGFAAGIAHRGHRLVLLTLTTLSQD